METKLIVDNPIWFAADVQHIASYNEQQTLLHIRNRDPGLNLMKTMSKNQQDVLAPDQGSVYSKGLQPDCKLTRPGWQIICRLCSGTTQQQTEGEQRIQSLLKAKFPKATDVQVADISGGCGSMYEILLESEEFKGHRTIAQHRMVNEVSVFSCLTRCKNDGIVSHRSNTIDLPEGLG
ncbi:BolA-like protein 3 [Lamellibrachia satsuma]|nr:BolA-like protein 3 [Lamellibrachia satsuma]